MVTVCGLPAELELATQDALAGSALPVVVAGAGRQATGRFLDLTQEEWSTAVAGAKAAFQTAQHAAAGWEASGEAGRIVFVVSTASVRVVGGAALDAAMGGFLTTIGQVAAVELGGKGITVNTVIHGWLEGDPAALAAGIPAGRLGRAAEVAAAIAFIASPAAGYVNGATLAVDGGAWITKTPGGSPLLPGAGT
jgi:NAD(P)-dependent dehydrogenase (short-subunit alcohol dehydrogenase family)